MTATEAKEIYLKNKSTKEKERLEKRMKENQDRFQELYDYAIKCIKHNSENGYSSVEFDDSINPLQNPIVAQKLLDDGFRLSNGEIFWT